MQSTILHLHFRNNFLHNSVFWEKQWACNNPVPCFTR